MSEAIDLDEYSRRRATLLAAWAAWDEQPANSTRVNAHVDAVIAYAGAIHVEFSKHAAAARRAGMTYEQAIDAWEADW